MDEPVIHSVDQVNRYIKDLLEKNNALENVWIRGEISNFTSHTSGHMYFTLKDKSGVIKAVMFKGNNRTLTFRPKNGDNVVVRGNIAVYEKGGYYQVIAKEMQVDGVGNLYLAYEALKKKLQEEGLFDPERKKEIPLYPKVIGVITSPTGAAIRDILTTIKRRYPVAKILFQPVLVQGDGAPESVSRAIEIMNEHGKADVLIVGRGGGSIEDLWAFNDEIVARTIAGSNIPIISAVGHETDFTIADFVADMRAPTPTAAAEMATLKSLGEIQNELKGLQHQLKKSLLTRYQSHQKQLEHAKKMLQYRHPRKKWQTEMQRLDQLTDQLKTKTNTIVKEKEHRLRQTIAKLDALSPLKTLNRGYSVVHQQNQLVKSIEQVHVSDEVKVTLTNGTLTCQVTHKEEKTI